MPLKKFIPSSAIELSYFFDDFPGLLYNNRMWSVRSGSGSLALETTSAGGVVYVRANSSNYYELYISVLNFTMARMLETTWRVKLPSTASIRSRWGVCGATSTSESVCFGYDSGVGSNWLLITITGSVTTTTDTGIAADTNWHEFRVACNTGIATFFIDEIPVGNNTTNLPTGGLSPFCRTTSLTTTTKDTYIDWIEIYGNRI